jgi:hypothetical protein
MDTRVASASPELSDLMHSLNNELQHALNYLEMAHLEARLLPADSPLREYVEEGLTHLSDGVDAARHFQEAVRALRSRGGDVR